MYPLVSVIMPLSRPQDRTRAIDIFYSQDYPNKELVIVNDEKGSSDDDTIKGCRVIENKIGYADKKTIGEKRNIACHLANGEIIIHQDSDDYYAPDWITTQVKTLLTNGADVCGLSKVYFYQEANNLAWQYVWGSNEGAWVAGATMCYHKEFWKRNQFKDMQVGEDSDFIWRAGVSIAVNEYTEGFVAMLHSNNTAPHNKSHRWQPCDVQLVKNIIK